MADATLTSFPAGNEVNCYPIAGCEPYKEQRRVPPQAASGTETVGTDSVLSFTGLTAGTYYAVGTVDGTVRFHAFQATD